MPTNEATVCYLCAGGKVLLQRRAAGRLWAGRLNGPGGKIDAGETATTAIVREVQEETGVRLDAQRPAGSLDLRFGDPPSQSLLVHVYGIHRLPFDDLWPDMRYWLPLVLAGGKVSGTCEYDGVGAALRACRLTLEWPQR